ncbi:MAG: dehydratase [bacterium]|nr:dehydratase [bacterium]
MAESTPTAPRTHRLAGLLFDDFAVGDVIESASRTITEADIQAFAGLSGDYNPLHTDEPHASRSAFRGRVAHGMLIQAIASGLVNQTGAFHYTIAALAEMNIRYTAPVKPGDTISARLVVSELDPDPRPKRGWVLFDGIVTNQRGQHVIESEWRTIFLRQRRSRER